MSPGGCRHRQPELSQRGAVQPRQVPHPRHAGGQLGDPQVRVGGLTVGEDGPPLGPQLVGHLPRPRVVGEGHHEPVRGHRPPELDERLGQPVQIPVRVEVVRIDVGNDAHVRVVAQKRPVRLVRLDDEVLAGAVVRATPQLGHLSPDHKGGIEPGVLQHVRQHGGGGGLAMRAGHRHRTAAGHRRYQRLRPVQDTQPPLARLHQLQVVVRNRGRIDHRVHAIQIGWLVAQVDGASQGPQRRQRRPLPQLATGHRDAPGQQQPGQTSHPDSAHPDQVDRPQLLGGQRLRRLGHGHDGITST